MEEWELEFEWLKLRHYVKDSFNRGSLPDLQSILFLIGIQELGQIQTGYTKEEKQDLMHIAVCSLLEADGYYEFEGRDADGWPHFKIMKPFTMKGVDSQEDLLKRKIIQYFNER
jgi:hypothetical protein